MLTLSPFTSAHFSVLADWFQTHPQVVQWGGSLVSYPLNDKHFLSMLEDTQSTPPKRLCWMVLQNGISVGHAQLAFEWNDGNARLGRVVIAPSERGKGLARPMVNMLIEQAFAMPGIERLELNVYTFNVGAIHIYKSLGFTLEGVRRSSTRAGDERWDTGMMGLLRSDWAASA